jgi:preprotein translocase subunit SecE
MATSHAYAARRLDKAKLGLAVTLVAALAGFYTLSKQGQLAQWGVLGLAAAVVVLSAGIRQLQAFGRDSWREVKKVVCPRARRRCK